MNLRKTNEVFGYMHFIVGALKILVLILILSKLFSNLSIIYSGGEADLNYYSELTILVGWMEIILAVSSVIMIIINIKYHPKVINGYLLGLGAVLCEFIFPKILAIFSIFIQSGLYMKAGTMIRKNNLDYSYDYKPTTKTTKKIIRNTEDYYSSNEKEQVDIKEEKRRMKLEKELNEWKQLLDLGEVDETTYTNEINKLKKKEEERKKKKRTKVYNFYE